MVEKDHNVADSFDRRKFLKLAGSGLVLISIGSQPILAEKNDLKEIAKKKVAEKTGTDVGNLEVVNSATSSWSTLGENYFNAKIYNESNSSIHQILLDGDGEEVDKEKIDQREQEVHADRYGKLSKDLHSEIQGMDDDDRLRVVVWLESIDHAAAKEKVGIENKPNQVEMKKSLSEEYKRRITKRTESFAETVSNFSGVDVEDTGVGSITVDVTVPKAVLSKIEKQGKVTRITKWDEDKSLPLTGATLTHRTTENRKTPAEIQYDLSGYKIGHAEFNHPDSNDSINFGGKRWDGGSSGHPGHTAECLASDDEDKPGTAYQADVYSADDIFNNISDRFDWFDSNGVCAINASVGSGDNREIRPRDYKFGQQVYHSYLNIIVSAGNRGKNSGNVNTPSVGFNVNSVGSIADSQDGEHSNDSISSFSSYKDSYTKNVSSGSFPHEKPEFCGVGSGVSTPNYSGSGTSLSSPIVTGLVAAM